MDDLDANILLFLQQDGRMAYSRIAQELGVSESTVYARVRSMLNRGVISGFTAVTDPERLGFGMSALVLIQMDPKRAEAVLYKLKEMDEVTELYDVTGEYYAVAKVTVRDRAELSKTLDRVGMLNGVTGTQTMLILRRHKETRSVKPRR